MEEPPPATATEPPSRLRLTLKLRALRTMRNKVDLPMTSKKRGRPALDVPPPCRRNLPVSHLDCNNGVEMKEGDAE
ncbi:hypothetical protein C1H46_028486 [Malus baccata]|uniref:Uncharacterized protein n=1 Tax=Malus baccata TaxID=106549 RepID=A0A540LHM3_MALBA|nr:hypothetical protein C1H46_028486 [Malus baccata]